ncbi:MAG: sigma-70 family RNA polymerase sigma factor [Proteobacteria bacterium]|nr:sigma-70 family RNA polymerase sigma factor [Pseudomonadota bacterium]
MAVDIENYYRVYGPMVLRRCRRLLKNEDKAVDAMQDTFVQLLRHRDRLKHKSPSSLLYRIATNICLNQIRAAGRRPEDLNDDLVSRIANLEDAESRLNARNLLERLFSRERASTGTIAVMHLLDGMTLEEVADQVGMSVSGVRKRLRPLRSKLQELQGVSP